MPWSPSALELIVLNEEKRGLTELFSPLFIPGLEVLEVSAASFQEGLPPVGKRDKKSQILLLVSPASGHCETRDIPGISGLWQR